MNIDVCITATLRPEIFKITIDSFFKFVVNNNSNHCFNFILNIDSIPTSIDSIKTANEIFGYLHDLTMQFENTKLVYSIIRKTDSCSFSAAVINNWKETKSPLVFQLEDDWKFIKNIHIYDRGVSHYKYIRYPKAGASIQLKKLALQPSLWSGDLVRNLSKYMSPKYDPEKQLRPGFSKDIDKFLPPITMMKDYESVFDPCCIDIGTKWRDDHKIGKWGKNNKGEITWNFPT